MSDNEILERALDNDKNESIIKLNSSKILKIKENILDDITETKQAKKEILKKLKLYRYVEELPDMELGNYIRWIPLRDPDVIKLTNGGIIIGIDLLEDGIHIRCKNNMNRIIQIRLNENLVFQKLTDQEQILLKVVDYLER
tara:strand:- start:12023 stop:12445 length:423 start_codon:yes stop_codon:yes gene_type:complete